MKISLYLPIYLIISSLTMTNVYSQVVNSYNNTSLKCVVIDAGHGGNDPGATFGKTYEKNITLSIALELGKMITETHPSVKVIYTRKSDIAIDLYKRSQIANDAKADLFISIHVNSARNYSARGVETFLMGTNQSSKNMDVAMKENSVITFEENYEQKYEGFDPKSAESYIIFSLMQYSFLEQSRIFASAIQEEYTKTLTTPNRGVKQAGFLVLWRTSMPSVLTEIGFISNSEDRSYLISNTKQKAIATSLLTAFTRYKRQMDSGVKEISITPTTEQNDDDSIDSETQPSHTLEEISTPVVTHALKETTTTKQSKSNSVEYRVQISSVDKKVPIISANFGKFSKNVEVIQSGKLYKYYIPTKTYKEAQEVLKSVKASRFKDAFISAYENNKRIDIKEAIAITN